MPVVISFIVDAGSIRWPLFHEAKVSPPSVTAKTPKTEDFRDSLREIDSTYRWAFVLACVFFEAGFWADGASTGSATEECGAATRRADPTDGP